MKVCSSCKEALDDRAFYRNTSNGKLRACCIKCSRAKKKGERMASRQDVKAWDAPPAIAELNSIQSKWSHR
jgi:hypothetical protein